MFEIGNSLREARVRQQLELVEVEQATKIRARYLRALEEESFDVLPAQTYVKGFLRTYADYLGLDGQLYLDEYNSRFGSEEEPREPVVARRSAHAQRHRRLESRGVVLALVGIGAVFAFVIAAWKFGGSNGNEQIPNLRTAATSTTTTTRKPVTPAVSKPARRRTPKLRLYVRAVHGNCWMDVRRWSQNARSLYTGTVELGQAQRFVARRLWVNFGAPWNLAVVFNGKVVNIPRTGAYLFTPKSFSRAA